MFFRDIPGQEKLKERLVRSVKEGRISHAMLLYGNEGCGNLALSLAFARYVHCTDRQESDACGTCPSCVKYDKYVHPDMHFVFPSNKVAEENCDHLLPEWRECILGNPFLNQQQWLARIEMENKQGAIGVKDSINILRKLSMKPYESEYKILLLWLPEVMNPSASNKILKMVEEPPNGTIFLLVSGSPEDILLTIRSRTQMIRVPRLTNENISSFLMDRYPVEEKLAEDVARISNGNFNQALELVKSTTEEDLNYKLFVNLMRVCYAGNLPGMMQQADELAGLGRERQKTFLLYSIRMLRENLMLNLQHPELSFLNTTEAGFSEKFSKFIHQKNTPSLYEQFQLAYDHITANGNPRIIFTDLSLKIGPLLQI